MMAVDDIPTVEPMDTQRLAALVRQELDQSSMVHGAENQESSATGLQYYLRELPRNTTVRGGTNLRSTDIPDVVDALLAEILPLFTSSPRLAEYAPLFPGDQEQSRQESEFVNYVFWEECNGAKVIYDALVDGLVQRNAVLQAEPVEELETEYKEFPQMSREELLMMQQAHLTEHPNETLEVVDGLEILQPPTEQEVAGVMAPERFDVRLRRTWKRKYIKIQTHAPEYVYVNEDHDELDLEEARFVAINVTPTRSELIEMGVDESVVSKISEWRYNSQLGEADRVRNETFGTQGAAETSGERVECYRVFYRVDTDGDGVSELHSILYGAHGHILEDKIVECSYLAAFSPWAVPHRFSGQSVPDKLEEITKAKTTFLRATADAAIRNVTNRLVYVGNPETEESLNSNDPFKPIRVRAQGDVQVIGPPSLGDTGIKAMEILDKSRRERIGSSLDLQSSGAQNQMVPGDTAHGVERVITQLEKQSAQIARSFSEFTLKPLFRHIHQILRLYDFGQISYSQGGQIQSQTPAVWPQRRKVHVRLGLSDGEKIQRRAGLGQLFEIQRQLLEMHNGTLVSEQQLHATLVDLTEALAVPDAETRWINPASPQAQQVAQQKQQQAQEQAQQVAQQQQMQMQLQAQVIQLQELQITTKAENERLKIQLDAASKQQGLVQEMARDRDESQRAWTKEEREAGKDLGPEGRYM